jgi:thioredoxin-related protein
MRRCSVALMLLPLLAVRLGAGPACLGYDPDADPFQDLQAAVREAEASGRRILVEVGGDWCSWCHILDRFLHEHDEIRNLWKKRFVTLKVHHDDEQPNEAFLSRYPRIEGYPHIFVLDSDGALLHSQNTALLESGETYSPKKMRDFLTRWAPGVDTDAASEVPE